MSTHIEHLRGLYKDCNLVKEDIYTKEFRGGKSMTIITRTGIEKIQSKMNISYDIEVISCTSEYCAIKLIATMGEDRVTTLASASKANATVPYYPELAEKRGLARAVIKLTKAAQLGVYSEDEVQGMEADETQNKKTKPTIGAPAPVKKRGK